MKVINPKITVKMRETILLRKTMAFCLLVSLTLPVSATASRLPLRDDRSTSYSERQSVTLVRKKMGEDEKRPRRLPAPVSACYDDTYLYISTLAATVGYAVTAADATVAASGTAVTADGEARIPLAGFEPGVYTLTLAADGVVYEGMFVVDGGMK